MLLIEFPPKMKRLRSIFTEPFPKGLFSLPGGTIIVAVIYVLAALYMNASLIYSLRSGEIQARWSFRWIEARTSAPVLYWCYIAGFGAAVIIIDAYFLYAVWKSIQEIKKT